MAVGSLDAEETQAFARVLGERPYAALTTLFVGLPGRGLGVGAALHDTAVAHIRATGRLPVLDVLPTHAGALELYRRRGWRTAGRMRFEWMPLEEDDVHLMVLDL